MRIIECFRPGRPAVSFEFFPPRSEAGFTALYRTIAELKRLDPAFVSVMWGAGGSTRRQTEELVARIQGDERPHGDGPSHLCRLEPSGAGGDPRSPREGKAGGRP